jgi:hypothetical protein
MTMSKLVMLLLCSAILFVVLPATARQATEQLPNAAAMSASMMAHFEKTLQDLGPNANRSTLTIIDATTGYQYTEAGGMVMGAPIDSNGVAKFPDGTRIHLPVESRELCRPTQVTASSGRNTLLSMMKKTKRPTRRIASKNEYRKIEGDITLPTAQNGRFSGRFLR